MKLGIDQYKAFLEELAKSKKVDLAEMKKKMATCGPPGFTGGAGGVSISKKWLNNFNWNFFSGFSSTVFNPRQTATYYYN